jgi:thiol:disulfide interchange protein DsbD
MSLIPQLSNPYTGAFAGGLLYGLAVCTASCLPYIASYIAGIGAGFRKGFGLTLVFSSGRIAGYALIGAVVGLFSGLFRLFVSATAFSPFQVYASLAFGVVTMIIGVSVLVKSRRPCECKTSNTKSVVTQDKKSWLGFDLGAFSLGLSRGLIICPPLIALLVYSLPFSTPIGSLSLAVLFGLGTALSPMLFLGGVTGWLLNKAPLFRKWVSIGGAGVLILLGASSLINSLIHM